MSEIQVILVNENDEEIGVMEKISAHQTSQLHRAFSVVIFNESGEMLLQKRALEKYHSPGQWSNACCGHPLPNEKSKEGAERRLLEEMGFTAELAHCFTFQYKAEVGGGLMEHEIDHVFKGSCNMDFQVNESEVMDWKWMSLQDLRLEMALNPSDFTPWFLLLMEQWQSRGNL